MLSYLLMCVCYLGVDAVLPGVQLHLVRQQLNTTHNTHHTPAVVPHTSQRMHHTPAVVPHTSQKFRHKHTGDGDRGCPSQLDPAVQDEDDLWETLTKTVCFQSYIYIYIYQPPSISQSSLVPHHEV